MRIGCGISTERETVCGKKRVTWFDSVHQDLIEIQRD